MGDAFKMQLMSAYLLLPLFNVPLICSFLQSGRQVSELLCILVLLC